jgi:hypothetical protein
MQWFRRHRHIGAQAALIALAIQFVVTFGHIHALEPTSGPPAVSADAIADNSSFPIDHGTRHPGDFCAICATIHLTGSAQVSAAPAVPAPIVFVRHSLALVSDSACPDFACLEHRSRGPPQA